MSDLDESLHQALSVTRRERASYLPVIVAAIGGLGAAGAAAISSLASARATFQQQQLAVLEKYHQQPTIVDPTPSWVLEGLLAVTAIGVGISIWYLVSRHRTIAATRKRLAVLDQRQAQLHAAQLEQLKTVTPLATLLELNQKQIDQYHRIATEQADQSFRSSQRAMWVGLFVIAACVVAGIYVQASDAKIFLGAVAAIGAALSGYLNRTYLNMYAQTLGQLNRYFEQPVLTSFYLTAERLAKDLADDPESEVRRKIVDQVLAASAQMSKVPAPANVPAPRRTRKAPASAPSDGSGSATDLAAVD